MDQKICYVILLCNQKIIALGVDFLIVEVTIKVFFGTILIWDMESYQTGIYQIRLMSSLVNFFAYTNQTVANQENKKIYLNICSLGCHYSSNVYLFPAKSVSLSTPVN